MSKQGLIGELLLAAAPLGNDFLKELIEHARLFGGENGPAWKAVLQRTRKADLPDPPRPALFAVEALTKLARFSERRTNRCFKEFVHRGTDFDSLLPKTQPSTDACTITTLNPKRDCMFAEVMHALPGVERTWDTAAIGRSLIANGYTMTLVQAEDMVDRTRRGESTGMRVNGADNLFFLETNDEKNPASIGSVRDNGSGWSVYLDGLDIGRCHREGHPFLVRNLDASKL